MPGLSLKKLEEQRLSLIRFIETQRPQGSVNNSVHIVFDGKAEIFGGTPSSSVQVTFARHESADDEIRKLVKESSHKRSVVVVTDDREVQYAVRSMGARVSSVREFLSRGLRSERQKDSLSKDESESNQTKVSRNMEDKITAEFEDIWLKNKDKDASVED